MMHPAVPPRRPRPGPRPAAPPAAAETGVETATEAAPRHPEGRNGTVVVSGEVIRVPGLGAFLRRNPQLARRGALASIAVGVALFAGASMIPLASADVAKPATPHRSSPPSQSASAPDYAIDPAAPVVMRLLKTKPTHVKNQAPVSHGVISGLAANGIPSVALNAYRVAAARMSNVDPGCGIDWALLAGIGREESDHGRFGGAVLHSDGVSTPSIIGPALDGKHWDYIPAPANGQALDGDSKYAHALGPMQFIPSTWSVYGTDATGDGKADIFNINDAALGAARYLCAAGGNLRAHAGQVRAVLAYNHSDQYLAQVLALADAYRRGVSISGIPVGITKGALPKVTDTGYVPPANPGAPTAVGGTSGPSKAKPKASTSPTAGKTTTAPATSKSASTSAKSTGTATKSPSPTPTKSTTPPKSSSTPTPKPTCNLAKGIIVNCTIP